MTSQNEAHEDAFFQAGTEGTYQGGPGSLVPVELEDWVEPPPNVPTEERLERRRKLQRVVVSVVATLSVGLFLAVAVRGASGRQDGANAAHAALAPATVVETPHPEPVAVAEDARHITPPAADEVRQISPPATDDARQISPSATKPARGPSRPEQHPQRSSYEHGTHRVAAKQSERSGPPTANFPDLTGHLESTGTLRGIGVNQKRP